VTVICHWSCYCFISKLVAIWQGNKYGCFIDALNKNVISCFVYTYMKRIKGFKNLNTWKWNLDWSLLLTSTADSALLNPETLFLRPSMKENRYIFLTKIIWKRT